MSHYFKNRNWWRIGYVVFGIYFMISGYVHGLFNSLSIGILLWACYSIGRLSAERDAVLDNKD